MFDALHCSRSLAQSQLFDADEYAGGGAQARDVRARSAACGSGTNAASRNRGDGSWSDGSSVTVFAAARLQRPAVTSTASSVLDGAPARRNANDLATKIIRKRSIGAWRVE